MKSKMEWNGIIKHVNKNVKIIVIEKNICSWNPCIVDTLVIAIYVTNIVSTKMKNAIAKNISINKLP